MPTSGRLILPNACGCIERWGYDYWVDSFRSLRLRRLFKWSLGQQLSCGVQRPPLGTVQKSNKNGSDRYGSLGPTRRTMLPRTAVHRTHSSFCKTSTGRFASQAHSVSLLLFLTIIAHWSTYLLGFAKMLLSTGDGMILRESCRSGVNTIESKSA